MMNALLFLIILLLSFPVFFIPKSLKYFYTLFLLAGGITLSSIWCFEVFSYGSQIHEIQIELPLLQKGFTLIIDKLSAFFIVVINITVFVGFIYARG
jgi:hydrogenase-4 component B